MRGAPAALLSGLLAAGAGGAAHAPEPVSAGAPATEPADPCSGFSWNVAHERALFKEVPQKISAGASPADAPAIPKTARPAVNMRQESARKTDIWNLLRF